MNTYNNKQNTLESLIKKYPMMLSFEEGSLEPFALFGFECGEGWYDLIYNVLETIDSTFKQKDRTLKYYQDILNNLEEHIKNKRTWYKGEDTDEELIFLQQYLYSKAFIELKNAKETMPRFVQIKEKFGTLRLYYEGGDDTVAALVSFAENMSAVTCDVCGNKGKATSGGWISVRCEEHAKK